MDLTMTIVSVPVKTVGAGEQRQETSFKLRNRENRENLLQSQYDIEKGGENNKVMINN